MRKMKAFPLSKNFLCLYLRRQRLHLSLLQLNNDITIFERFHPVRDAYHSLSLEFLPNQFSHRGGGGRVHVTGSFIQNQNTLTFHEPIPEDRPRYSE